MDWLTRELPFNMTVTGDCIAVFHSGLCPHADKYMFRVTHIPIGNSDGLRHTSNFGYTLRGKVCHRASAHWSGTIQIHTRRFPLVARPGNPFSEVSHPPSEDESIHWLNSQHVTEGNPPSSELSSISFGFDECSKGFGSGRLNPSCCARFEAPGSRIR